MNNKRKLYLIQFEDCYEIWLAKSKESLCKEYQTTSKPLTGLDFNDKDVSCKEILLKDIPVVMDVNDTAISLIEPEYNRLMGLHRDVLFFTNFI